MFHKYAIIRALKFLHTNLKQNKRMHFMKKM